MARLYRKRPVTVEAMQFLPDRGNVAEIIDFLIEGKVHHLIKPDGIVIRTMEGDLLATPGDFIIRGTQNEFYPCKPGIFAGIYEEV